MCTHSYVNKGERGFVGILQGFAPSCSGLIRRLPAAQTSDPQKQMDGTATENGGRAHVDSVWGMLAYLVVHMFDLCF